MSTVHHPNWEPVAALTRDAGLARLAEFLPHVATYGRVRNRAIPPYDEVSRLSVHLRYRLLLEPEVIAAVWEAHAPATVEKFVSEVLWRTYWKGWLELRPHLWNQYLEQVERDAESLTGTASLRYAEATDGRTGIACFDTWVRELMVTGYLHNHVRMWFASIWIFTLRLPWSLGAAFFLRHLHDGDPASNTLSWRWVAGLHTRGKHYLARAENIARYTDGRFNPKGELDEQALPVSEPPWDHLPRPLPVCPEPLWDQPSALLVTPEDLTPELSVLAAHRYRGIAGGWNATINVTLALAPPVIDRAQSALADALARSEAHGSVPIHRLDASDWLADVENWARGLGVRQIVTLVTPVGPWRTCLNQLTTRLAVHGIQLLQVRRRWDDRLWPAATHGFFRFRDHAQGRADLSRLVSESRSV
ncbi:hypothetical protein CKO25_03475 [Thiocapsa imhoffii]|uniref:Cryptochrome/DNA photolyase FAD-binding domain-containing protein n=1 Tax=Thiocapsa imhoffii TaxID=382777 RepID=A0A9X0WFS9_9GAMM|nr:FAD-binding domain-containing protein [Thiocapsa imhoffii]MBK1643736.1 hypothetical protein [Thiocapsa imhoffii]